jgi:hypothetical protein
MSHYNDLDWRLAKRMVEQPFKEIQVPSCGGAPGKVLLHSIEAAHCEIFAQLTRIEQFLE